MRAPLADMVGERAVELSGGTVGEVIATLEKEHPKVKGWVLDEAGAIRRHVNVFVEGEKATPDTRVDPDTRIEIIHAISGGDHDS